MVNIAKDANKLFSHVDSNLVAKYAKRMPELKVDPEKCLKLHKAPSTDKFERLAHEMNATKEKLPLAEIPELKVAKLPLWKKVLGKIFG